MAGKAAYGTEFKIGATAVANLTNIGGPSWAVDSIDVSAHDSADAYREFVAGLIDAGEVSLEGNLNTNAQFKTMLDQLNTRTATAMTIDFADGVNDITFNGFFTALNPSAPHDGKLGFSATVKIAGKATLST